MPWLSAWLRRCGAAHGILSLTNFENTSGLEQLSCVLSKLHALKLIDCYIPGDRNRVWRGIAGRMPNVKNLHISFEVWDILVIFFHYGGDLLSELIPDRFKKLETFELFHLPTTRINVIKMTKRFVGKNKNPVTIKSVTCVSIGNPTVSARERQMIDELGVGSRNQMKFEIIHPFEDFPKGGYSVKFSRV